MGYHFTTGDQGTNVALRFSKMPISMTLLFLFMLMRHYCLSLCTGRQASSIICPVLDFIPSDAAEIAVVPTEELPERP